MAAAKYLIVNADDLGQSSGINRGIGAAHERGIVTSASFMVRWPGAAEAADYARAHPRLDVGLHVDLGEWAFRNGDWVAVYEVVRLHDEADVTQEVARQLAEFRRMLGGDPTHLDSHQHVHRREPTQSVLTALARRLGVPLRHFTPGVRYCGNFYGQDEEGRSLPDTVCVAGLTRILAALPSGVSELACHPGYAEDLDTMYRTERAAEVQALCAPQVREVLESHGIVLCTFRDKHV